MRLVSGASVLIGHSSTQLALFGAVLVAYTHIVPNLGKALLLGQVFIFVSD